MTDYVMEERAKSFHDRLKDAGVYFPMHLLKQVLARKYHSPYWLAKKLVHHGLEAKEVAGKVMVRGIVIDIL